MKKKLFLFFSPIISLTVINVVSCQNRSNFLNEVVNPLNELENELKSYNWKTTLYNENISTLEKLTNDLEAIKLKSNIAEKLEYSEKTKFHNDQIANLKKKIEVLKTLTILASEKNNLENVNAIFNWINTKMTNYINLIKTQTLSSKNNKLLIDQLNKAEIINKFFTNFPINSIFLLTDQSINYNNQSKNCDNTCINVNYDISNYINIILHHFYIIEQMKLSKETDEEIITKKIELLHRLWVKLWENDLSTIYENLRNPNIDFIK